MDSMSKELLNMTSNANSKSDSENSNANGTEESQLKRRRYHRHTPEQIQELEAFFKECSHPDDGQRAELSQHLGLEPQQIKFWFQNKKTQMKTQREHKEITQLRAENEKLRAENLRLKEALSNASCPHCGAPTPMRETSFQEHQLRLENSRLRQEIDYISSASANYAGRTVLTSMETPSSSQQFQSGNFEAIYADVWSSMNNEAHNEGNRSVVVDLATSAMEELMRVAQLGEPLWVPSIDRNSSVLNEEEYFRAFSRVFRQKTNGFKSEASRESVVVSMRAASVVEILMDVVQWRNVFSGIVSRAENLQVISSGVGGTYNEGLLVVNGEFQVPSPLVPTRESCFLRYCKRHVDGIWAVVDVSLDHGYMTAPSVTCRRRPSGCLIQDIANGISKVTWVEHVEVTDGGVHSIYKPLITSGLAFGARRWVAILEGYCQRLIRTGVIPSENANSFLVQNQDGRRSLLKLAERMVTRFCCGVSASMVNTWTNLSGNGNENVKFIARTNVDDPSMPYGLLLTIATSIWIAVPPKRVFDFLCDNNTRKVWDMLLNGGDVEERMHILSGKEEFNRVTLYQVKGASSSSSTQMTLLQESRSDPTASYVVYAPIDMVYGEDPSNVPLLPSGFVILPDGPTGRGQGRRMAVHADTGGSLLTVALQILIDSSPNATLPMGTAAVASKVMWSSVDKIKQALISNS